MKSVLSALFLGVLLIASLTGCQPSPARKGSRARDFTLPCLDGGKKRLSELGKDKVVLLCFWASWCPSCMEEAGQLNKLYKKYKSRRLEIIGINYGESNETVLSVKKKLGIAYPLLLDVDGKILDTVYQLDGIPAVLLVDKKGIVRFMGSRVPRDKEIEECL